MLDDGACSKCEGHGKEWYWSSDNRQVDLEEDCHHCNGTGYEPYLLKTPKPMPLLLGWDEDPLEIHMKPDATLKPTQKGICTSCGHKDSIEFTDEKWRWVNGTTHLKVNCPSCDEWRSLAVLDQNGVKTVLVPAELPPS